MSVKVPPGLTIKTLHFIHRAYSYILHLSYYKHYSPVDFSNGSTQTVDGNNKIHTDLQMLTFIPSIYVQKLTHCQFSMHFGIAAYDMHSYASIRKMNQ